jgi:hypothetical protein
MKKIALLVALALVLPAWAQPAKEPAKPAAQEPAKPEAAKPEAAKPEAAKPEAAKPEAAKVAKKANPRRQQDARHCLDKTNNTEIIKCAEAYL